MTNRINELGGVFYQNRNELIEELVEHGFDVLDINAESAIVIDETEEDAEEFEVQLICAKDTIAIKN